MRMFESVGSDLYRMTIKRDGTILTLLVVANTFGEAEELLKEAARSYRGYSPSKVVHATTVQTLLNGAILIL